MSIPKPETGLAQFVQFLGIAAWLLLAFSQLIYWSAGAEKETFLDRHWEKNVREFQDTDMAGIGVLMLKILACLCAAGFIVNLLENLARGVHYNRSLIFVGGVAVVLLVFVGR